MRSAPSMKLSQPIPSWAVILVIGALLVGPSLASSDNPLANTVGTATVAGDGPYMYLEGPAIVGQSVRLVGRQFPVRSRIKLTWDGKSAGMPTVATGKKGAFSVQITPPEAGRHVIGAIYAKSSMRLKITADNLATLVIEVAAPVSSSPTPTATPKASPTASPTATPIVLPTTAPTASPTATPIVLPTTAPTASPTATPKASPTASPTPTPIVLPGTAPTASPTATPKATATPAGSKEYCSNEVHDKYRVTGPDGKSYPGWHPQRDPETGCYFGHEHGSNPALFAAAKAYQPAFGYVGAVSGFPEPHAGYKNFLVDDGQGHHWLFTVHIGTSGAGRVCNRFHGTDVAVARISTGELLARVHFMGDFGRAEDNKSLNPLTPDACPTQHHDARADDSKGLRQLSVNIVGEGQYEPWRVDTLKTITGFYGSGLVLNTVSAMTTCDSMKCNSVYATGHTGAGAWRVLDYTSQSGTETNGMRFVAGTHSGNFTTDGFARKVNGPVQQFVKPGIDIRAPLKTSQQKFWPTTPTDMVYRMSEKSPITAFSCNIDGMLKPPN